MKNREILQKFPKESKKYVVFPTIVKSNYETLIKNNIENISKEVDGFVISHIGQLSLVKKYGKEIIANYTFNIFNTYAINLLEDLGFSKIILSPELTKSQINALGGNLRREIIAYGNLCVMTSEYCPVGSVAGNFSTKNKCIKPCLKGDNYYLRDRMNMDFRILPDCINCESQIFNAKTTSIETNSLNVDSIRIDAIDEPFNELQKIIDIHKKGEKLTGNNYTNGHINRPV